MTAPSPPAGGRAFAWWPPNAEPYYRPAMIAAIAACVGVIVGSIGQWLHVFLFSVNGLDFQGWGVTTLILGVVSGLALLTELYWATTPFSARWAIPLAWAVVVAAVACLTDAVINIVRLMTIPSEDFLGVSIGVGAGWGLWLLAFSSAVLCLTASVVAVQIAKSVDLRQWASAWRWSAIVASVAIVVSGTAYAWANPFTADNNPLSASRPTATPSQLPSFPGFPSVPSLSTSTPTSTPQASAPATTSTSMSREQIEQFKTHMDALLDEVNPTLDTLQSALRAHDYAAITAACSGLGKLSQDLSDILPSPSPKVTAQLQDGVDKFAAAQRECLELGPFTTDAEEKHFENDLQQALQDLNPPAQP